MRVSMGQNINKTTIELTTNAVLKNINIKRGQLVYQCLFYFVLEFILSPNLYYGSIIYQHNLDIV